MGLLRLLRKAYTLDTLDTRFVTSAHSTTEKAISDVPVQKPPPRRSEDVSPSKWNTPEFYLYYLVFLTAIPAMFYVAMQVSLTSHPGYKTYSHLLSDGWILGRKVDNSDLQYASFRNNIPYMAVVLLLHPLLRRAYDRFWRIDTYTNVQPLSRTHGVTHGLSFEAAASTRQEQRLRFDHVFALIFIKVLHGTSSIKIVALLYINYQIIVKLPKRYIPLATWVFNICIIFANELLHGYPYVRTFGLFGLQDLGAALDQFGGLVPRWEVFFNMTVLRMISFNMDYYWSLTPGSSSPFEKKQPDPSLLSDRDRVTIPAQPEDFSMRNFFAYALYSPLYLAGPILTFNDYISQCRFQPQSVTRERTVLYGIRLLVMLLTMELVLHFIYVVAISKAHPSWDMYTPFQLSMLGYFNLHIIWLKLLIPWRLFRFWSLLDGIDPPENMARCMSDNFSTMAFWRGWHRSFNRWIIRYVFIPLGGSQDTSTTGRIRSVFNFLAVFTFVALWHDINPQLLMWGWLITLFVVPEIIASLLFPAKAWKDKPTAYRMLCGFGAIGNILMMMVANLVGFAIGVEGMKGLVHGIVGSISGVAFLATACGALFVGAQVMFEIREDEKRRGIRMKF